MATDQLLKVFRKPKYVLSVILVVLAVIIIASYYFGGLTNPVELEIGNTDSNSDPVIVENEPVNSSNINEKRATDNIISSANAIQAYYLARSYADYNKIVNADNLQSTTVQELFDATCYEQYTSGLEHIYADRDFLLSAIDTFCDGYSPKSSYLDHNRFNDYLDELSFDIQNELADRMEKYGFTKALMSMIANLASPLEAHALKLAIPEYLRAMNANNHIRMKDNNLDKEYFLSELDLDSTITLFACNKFNHCYKGQYEFIVFCLTTGEICKNYNNILDYVYANNSPLQMEAINAFLSEVYKYQNL